MIVLDASVLTDFLLGRFETLAAVERELLGYAHEPLHAPELVEPVLMTGDAGLAQRAGTALGRRRVRLVA